MRIAIVAESFLPRVNGVSNSVIRAATHLRKRGHDVLLIAPDAYTAEVFEGIPVARIRSVVIPGIHDTDVAVVTADKLAKVLENFKPHVLHLASPFVLGARAVKAAKLVGIPTVAIFQTDIAGFARHYGLGKISFIADSVIRKIHDAVDLTLVPSTDAALYLRELGVSKVERWGRGVDTAMFSPNWRDPELRSADSRLTVGFLGRLAPEKNVAILQHLKNLSKIRVVIIGDGPSRSTLEQQLPEAEFVGRLGGNDLSRQVASLDVLIATGERETFCQVVQEGMAAGLPVIAPNVGGPRDLILDGVNGFLYQPGNGEHLKECVLRFADNPGLAATMGADAWLTVQDRTWESVCDELLGHYERVVARSKSTAVS